MSDEDIWTREQLLRSSGISPEAMNRGGAGLYGQFSNADMSTKRYVSQMQEILIGQEKYLATELELARLRRQVMPGYEYTWSFAWLRTLTRYFFVFARWIFVLAASFALLMLSIAYVFGPLCESHAQSISGLDQWKLNDPARYAKLDPGNFNRPLSAKIKAAQLYLRSVEDGQMWKDTPDMRSSVRALFAAQIEGYRPRIDQGSTLLTTARMMHYQHDLQKRTGEAFTFNDTLPLLLANSGGVQSYAYLRDVTINLAVHAPTDTVAQARVAQVNSPDWMAAEKWHWIGRAGWAFRKLFSQIALNLSKNPA